MSDEKKVTIGFEMIDKNGCRHSARSCIRYFDEPILDDLGEQFNTFLKQVGYIRDNDYLFMESVTEDELNAISIFLHDYRETMKSGVIHKVVDDERREVEGI